MASLYLALKSTSHILYCVATVVELGRSDLEEIDCNVLFYAYSLFSSVAIVGDLMYTNVNIHC